MILLFICAILVIIFASSATYKCYELDGNSVIIYSDFFKQYMKVNGALIEGTIGYGENYNDRRNPPKTTYFSAIVGSYRIDAALHRHRKITVNICDAKITYQNL